MTRWVLHVDMDQFLAAVELLRRPELAGKPVVVGGRGDPTERAVVSTASYEARAFGIRSGVALRIAARKCPDAIFLPVDFPVYEAASQHVMATLKAWPGSVVEILGWDEAFVGIETDDPEGQARGVQAAVLDVTGLHCSIGIGDTLVRAKTATEFGKPQGTYVLTRANWIEIMGERPVTDLWGIGKRIGARLNAIDIVTVTDLAAADGETLIEAFGPSSGAYFSQLGRGEGRAWPDDSPWVPRARGHETTYQVDLTTTEVPAALGELAEQVMRDLRKEGRPCARVHLKVRFAPFFTKMRVRKLREPTWDPAVVASTALDLFTELGDERRVRLLGIRGEMVPPPEGY